MAFEALSQILAICQKESIDFAEAVLREDMKDRLVDREASIRQMTAMWESMCDASDSYDISRKSNSGLVGGAGGVMADYVAAGNTLCGDAMGRVIAQALQMGESNACMKRIVAAPTAGACGVLPAVLIPLFRDDPNTIRALFVAAGIGQVIATRASIAGASGGCQAEIGSASAMAAGALVYLRGGSCEQILNAVAMSLKNLRAGCSCFFQRLLIQYFQLRCRCLHSLFQTLFLRLRVQNPEAFHSLFLFPNKPHRSYGNSLMYCFS